MKVNLISALASVAALVASPAMATQMQNWRAAPVDYVSAAPHWAPYAAPRGMAYAPNGATYGAPRAESEFGPYTPSKRAPRYGTNNDFQSGGGDK
jgi:hypothetical protein